MLLTESVCCSSTEVTKRRIIFPSLHEQRETASDTRVHLPVVTEATGNQPTEERFPGENLKDTSIRRNILINQLESGGLPRLATRCPAFLNFPVEWAAANHSIVWQRSFLPGPEPNVDIITELPLLDTLKRSSILLNKSQCKYSRLKTDTWKQDIATKFRKEVIADHYCLIKPVTTNLNMQPTTEQPEEGRVKFKRTVRVREFQRNGHETRNLWFTRQEMHSFKVAAFHHFMENNVGVLSSATAHPTSMDDAGAGSAHCQVHDTKRCPCPIRS
jgi:hypothetical protein